jgi:hypothetical protein
MFPMVFVLAAGLFPLDPKFTSIPLLSLAAFTAIIALLVALRTKSGP